MKVTLSGIVIVVRSLQFWNEKKPIYVTPLGISIVFRLQQSLKTP